MIRPCVPTKSRSILEGSYDGQCQAKRFLDSSDCVEVFDSSNPPLKAKKDLFVRPFWYPDNATASESRPSLQQKIKTFLLILMTRLGKHTSVMRGEYVQLWTPIVTEDGRVVLSVAKQPFGVRRFTKGLCRYRYYSLEFCSDGSRTEVGCDFGPVGRAFSSGSPEFCPHMDAYEEESNRLKNHLTQHFKDCGIVGYLALPLFELGEPSCFGVLEFVSTYDYYLSSSHTRSLLDTLKEVGLAFRYPSDSNLLTQIRPYFNFSVPVDARKTKFDEIRSVLEYVRKMYSLPLIQVWLPCICKGSEVSIACDPNSSGFAKATHLVCGFQCFNKVEWQPTGKFLFDPQACFVEDGESWVGRAYAQKKICFIKDIRKSNIRDCPRVTFSDPSKDPVLSACFAVPLQLLHPKLPPLILEVLIPSRYNHHTNDGAILNPILFVLVRELSKYNAEFGLNKGEKYLLKTSQLEDGYDCVYFDVDRHRDASKRQHLKIATEENTRPCQVPSHESIGGRSTLKRKLPFRRRSLGVGRSPSRQRNDLLPVVQITAEFSTNSVNSSGEDQQSGIFSTICISSDISKERELEDARVSIPIAEKEAVIEPGNNEVSQGPHVGSIRSTNEKGKNFETENDEVDPVKVINTVSTLKRKLPDRGSIGMGRSPSRPRNDVLPVIQQTPEFSTNSVDSGSEDQQPGIRCSPSDISKVTELEGARVSIPISGREAVIEPENSEVSHVASIPSINVKGKNFESENDEINPVKIINTVESLEADDSCTLIVKARYKDEKIINTVESLEADDSCTLIVKARYKDEIVKFPFSSNSGIEGLQRDLLKRFKPEAERIKIKYQDDGDWITLACSEDLGSHINTLKSSGHATLDLSVFSVT